MLKILRNYRTKLMISIIISLISFSLIGCKSKDNSINKSTTDILIENSKIDENYEEAEEVIKNYYKYYNDKNEEKMLSCLLSAQSVSSYRLFNLDYINLKNINYISDKSRYDIYINNFLTKNKNFDIEMLKLYEVKYDIKFIEEIEPVKSGEITKEVMLVKLVGSDKWLIEGIGTM